MGEKKLRKSVQQGEDCLYIRSKFFTEIPTTSTYRSHTIALNEHKRNDKKKREKKSVDKVYGSGQCQLFTRMHTHNSLFVRSLHRGLKSVD